MSTIDMAQVQGFVFSGYYDRMPFASYYLLQIENAALAKNWLRMHRNDISFGDVHPSATATKLNLAITHRGCETLGLGDKELQAFEPSFQEGMTTERSKRLLGDYGDNDPGKWLWGNSGDTIHILLMIFSDTQPNHDNSCSAYAAEFEAAGLKQIKKLDASAARQNSQGLPLGHFDFADGLSEPGVEGFPTSNRQDKAIATGEFLLGYPDEYSRDNPDAQLDGGFRANGTYLVFRQLHQHVSKLREFLESRSAALGFSADYLAAKMLGRWRSGAVIKPGDTVDPNCDRGNQFDFSDDPDGFGCPFGAHISRANPRGRALGEKTQDSLRVANRHRILRRSRSYGEYLPPEKSDDNLPRGLLFICLNASIERQFEFIQKTWINNVKFNGLYDEDDPLTGAAADHNFTIQHEPLRKRVCGFGQFVTATGGAYFFLPSRAALDTLMK